MPKFKLCPAPGEARGSLEIMSWRLLSEDDIVTGLTGPETVAFKNAALRAGQSDPLAEIMAQVSHEVRAHIADCDRNQLAAGLTLPERCILHAVALVRYRMMTRIGISVNDEREVEYRDARRFLERVSECRVRMESPPAGERSEEGGGAPTIEVTRSGGRRASHDDLKGL